MGEKAVELYHHPNRYFVINNGDGLEKDRDLIPIYISLPKPPPLHKIKNYGLHPEQQVYRRDEIPEKLITLEERAKERIRKAYERNKKNIPSGYKILREYWKILEEEKDYYEKEIKFIKNTVWKTVYGEWVFLYGKPTYICGWHYEYLNFWYMPDAPGNYPEYRDVDRLEYLFDWYIYNTRETFKKIDKDGFGIKNPSGEYEMIDTGGRLFYGTINPKNRRSGASHRALAAIFAHMRKSVDKNGVLISKSTVDVEKHYYRRLIPAWQRYPMFLKPVWDGSNSPSILTFKEPSNENFYKGIGSSIYYVDTTAEVSLDSQEIEIGLFDEQGKRTGGGRVDVFERWEVSKQTMSKGNGAVITGFCFNPSTVEEMEDGGESFKMMCEQSNFYQRLPNGQTKSGLALCFFPAQVRLEGFIDAWGRSVVDKPTARQIKFSPKARFATLKKGAKEYLKESRDRLLMSGSEEDKKTFRSQRRKHPMNYSEVWLSAAGGMGFDIEIIDNRLVELDRMEKTRNSPIKRGHFKWLNDKPDTTVIWETVTKEEYEGKNDPNARFEIAMELPLESTNQKRRIQWLDVATGRSIWAYEPVDYRFMCGADPFEYGGRRDRITTSRQSDGGIAVLWMHDPKIDPGENMREWDSYKFVLSYRYRPESQAEYNEDVLMACIYFGALLYPERNVSRLWEYFIERGYAGYLAYDINPITGKRADKPGAYTSASFKDEMFSATKDYIKYRGHKEFFASYLEEVKLLRTPEDLTKLDRFAAHGMALMGAKTLYPRRKREQNTEVLNLGKSKKFSKYL